MRVRRLMQNPSDCLQRQEELPLHPFRRISSCQDCIVSRCLEGTTYRPLQVMAPGKRPHNLDNCFGTTNQADSNYVFLVTSCPTNDDANLKSTCVMCLGWEVPLSLVT